MNRKLARDTAYKMIFGYLFTGELNNEIYSDSRESGELDQSDIDYITQVTSGVKEHETELRETIAKYSKGFIIDRVYKPDLAILLLAIYEMKYIDSIPLKVSISEAVAIVKIYSTTKSFSFVNGILASVYRELEVTDGAADKR